MEVYVTLSNIIYYSCAFCGPILFCCCCFFFVVFFVDRFQIDEIIKFTNPEKQNINLDPSVFCRDGSAFKLSRQKTLGSRLTNI